MSLRLFDAVGIELEYMIVDRATLAVRPIADRLLAAASLTGTPEAEVALGPISWSNELAAHVVELKTTSPAPALGGLAARFQENVGRIEAILEPWGARLMPSAMHPLMEPDRETVLWPHGNRLIYETFDRIFDCRGHGWSNLQSMHINLPFDGDEEFARLHGAIRVILPLLPALAASSPIVEGRPTGLLDNRLEFYRHNCRRIPEVTGRVIPEGAASRADYDRLILGPMYDAVAPQDPEGLLRHEWLNARGAIARFERSAVEIRLLDVQECPRADLAVAAMVVAAVRALAFGRWSTIEDQRAVSTEALETALLSCIRDGERAEIADPSLLRALGPAAPRDPGPIAAGDLWKRIYDRLRELDADPDLADPEVAEPLALILDRGPLARRILGDLGDDPPRSAIAATYDDLCTRLSDGRAFP